MKIKSVFLVALFLGFFLYACQNTTPIKSSCEIGVNEEKQISYIADHDVTFSTSDSSIVSVTNDGLMKGIAVGNASVTVTDKKDATLSEIITVTVLEAPSSIFISGSTVILYSETTKMEITTYPSGASKNVFFEIDDDIIAIDENGVVTALEDGKTTIRAKSKSDITVSDSLEITVRNLVIVDATKSTGDVSNYNNATFTFGKSLFSSLNDALDIIADDTEIHVLGGTIIDAASISKNNITLIGKQNAKIANTINVSASQFTISDFELTGTARINATNTVDKIAIDNCKFINITGSSPLIYAENLKDFSLTNSDIQVSNITAIEVTITDGELLLRKNTISGAKEAIVISVGSEYTNKETISITRNTIDNVETAFELNLLDADIKAIARYNAVTNYSKFAVNANADNKMDFSLNYWDNFALAKFNNVSAYFLAGHYEKKTDILPEEYESPDSPAVITIDNIVDEINVNDNYKFILSFLPYEFVNQNGNITFTSSNRDIVSFTASNELIIRKSGNVDLSVQSAQFGAIKTTMNVDIITDPGVIFIPSSNAAAFVVSDSLSFDTLVFPFTIANSKVSFSSSNENIASIDTNGIVTSKAPGTVTFIASINILNEDGTLKEVVENEFTTVFFESLSNNSLLDYLTLNQMSTVYDKTMLVRGWNGVYYYYGVISPSYYSYSSFQITQSFIPEGSSVRPGLNDPLPEGIPKYNDKNIYWVVFHDTADSKMGAADYGKMLSNPDSGSEVSWHYSVDDKEVYQHLPEGEIGYHAGDGRTNPGTSSTYLGGGNRNGVGIESSVREGDDIFKVWHNGAKLVAQILVRNNLPLENAKYHQDFSGKKCPETMIVAGMVEYFEKLKEVEYTVLKNFEGAVISMESSNTEYLTNDGRVQKLPEKTISIKYTITVTYNGTTEQRDLYLYLAGTLV